MPEPLCIYCYDPVTTENGDPLYLHASADMLDAAPTAWVHKGCLADLRHALPDRGHSRERLGCFTRVCSQLKSVTRAFIACGSTRCFGTLSSSVSRGLLAQSAPPCA